MAIRLVRIADRVHVPWKNRAGVTEEIALTADAAGTPLWRISVADIPGPPTTFSTFEGVDRIFTIIGEHGVALSFPASTAQVDPLTPYRFTEEGAPQCHPDGRTRALNVMAQHDFAGITVSMLPDRDHESVTTDPTVITGMYVISGSISAGDLVGYPGDCFLIDHSGHTLSVDGTAISIEIAPR